ncbi:MAG: class I SAM-dependent DNA methyltransferase [Firmicutes bacterium]|nr:class I SAM-dependent DNA methyltransferase [Bacillota bacterium]
MNTKIPEKNITKISLRDLQSHYALLDFLLSPKVKKITEEMELSLKAGELVGKIHDRFQEQYNDPLAKKTQNSLNILCVRLVFCLYAEDAGLFGAKDAFSKYLSQYEPKDIRRALLDLFKVLDTPIENREELYLDDELAAFPYCNGGLFARENIEIPKITQEIKDTIIESALFDWSKISPTIFGAVFESTLNPETRRSGGMHYTSIENIHKVIDPLFLDNLKNEYTEIMGIGVSKIREQRLLDFQKKLAGLQFLDPACGSGNFLTETYICLRRIENQILRELQHGQIILGMDEINPIKVGIDQFYGIEINDFAVTVAKTALWIAESQMMKETEDVVHMNLDFLPLKTNANIIEGNALQLDWNRIINKQKLSFIMGNPPFSGGMVMSTDKKEDMRLVIGDDASSVGEMDYVAAWYFKAARMIQGTEITTCFVSTNSIVQGQQAITIWEPLFKTYKIIINFAYRTFKWTSEANDVAAVHCVIIGMSCHNNPEKIIYQEDGKPIKAKQINSYLADADSWFLHPVSLPICDVPPIRFGSMPRGKAFIMTKEERDDIIQKYPDVAGYLKEFYMGNEFINGGARYCMWLVDADIALIKKCPPLMARIEDVRQSRLESKASATRKMADTPMLFAQIAQPDTDYIAVPAVSTQRRRYIPIGFLSKNVIAGNKLYIIPDAKIYHFGIITSNVHMAWMRVFAGRMKSDYSYSKDIVYNNFPWPTPSESQRQKIEQTAQSILDARNLYPNNCLAELYDELTMPSELRKAHQANDRAVMTAYGLDIKNTSEEDCVAFLMKMYLELSRPNG